jgi:protein SCO1/2
MSRVRDSKRSVFSWKSFGISMGILGVFFGLALYYKREKQLKLELERKRSLGKAAIGGSFELMDMNKQMRSSKDFLGKWVLLYFGFSHCPDVCPDEMEKMVKAVDKLDTMGMSPIQMLFITVDPERDTPEVVAAYVKEFSPKMLGLTGTKEQIAAATKAYRVYYSAGPRDEGNDYIVDHTIIMYLINPEGEFVDYYGQTKDADQIANGISMSMIKYKQLKKKAWI